MKKLIPNILNITSIASAIILLLLAGFCAYEWVHYSDNGAYIADFLDAMQFYPTYLFAFSISGIITSGTSFIIIPEHRKKITRILLFIFFILCLTGAATVQHFIANYQPA